MFKTGQTIKYYYDDLGEIHFHTNIIKNVFDNFVITENDNIVLFSEIIKII